MWTTLKTWRKAIVGEVQILDMKFQESLGWLNRLPTWANEPLGGVIPMLPLLLLCHAWSLPIYLVLSHLREKYEDPYGYSADDVLWRAYGAVLAYVSWVLL